jgi:hypothetical protein
MDQIAHKGVHRHKIKLLNITRTKGPARLYGLKAGLP